MIKILRLVILFWSLTALSMTGQTVFTGRVTDLSGQVLPHVFVKACPAGRPTALAYVRSDQQGAYTLKVGKDAGKELDLRFSAVGYTEIIRRVPNRSTQVDVSLQATDKQLHEVPPLERHLSALAGLLRARALPHPFGFTERKPHSAAHRRTGHQPKRTYLPHAGIGRETMV